MAESRNKLLASLPANEFAAVKPHLKNVDLVFGTVVAEPGQGVKRVYFPHSGAISLVVELKIGDMIETAMVGNDGVVNAASALDGKVSLNKGIVQVAGASWVIDVDQLRKLADQLPAFRALLIRHEQVLFAQSQQSAACNASHSVENRMCRWLLRMRDLANSDDLMLTQEFLAQMLGVRRPSVSIVANTLQKAGLIKYRRGHIRVLDVNGLREGSCECYAAVSAHYGRLLLT
jgi:CRP-like cAMP-binding protein